MAEGYRSGANGARDANELRTAGSFESQAAMFATALTMAVAGLGEDGYIPPSVRELGARHEGYGLPEKSYAAFGEALLWTLKARLAERFTPEGEAAGASA